MIYTLLLTLCIFHFSTHAFLHPSRHASPPKQKIIPFGITTTTSQTNSFIKIRTTSSLQATGNGEGGKKKKRRRRKKKKKNPDVASVPAVVAEASPESAPPPVVATPPSPPPPPSAPAPAPAETVTTPIATEASSSKSAPPKVDESAEKKQADLKEKAKLLMEQQANFDFTADAAIGLGGDEVDSTSTSPIPDPSINDDNDFLEPPKLELPKFREIVEMKKEKDEKEEAERAKAKARPKIQRGDQEALKNLLEQEPFADADDSFFEEEEYSIVNALLGERAKTFLGVGLGPLQVGHFIGALGIVLMAFVEYPGFPLTNLPSPLRGALQGGLGTVYAINLVLAIIAVFKAMERGQSPAFWALKTFSVGGLAYDQLTQIPTKEEIEESKSRKGRRAPGKNKRRR